MPRQGLLPVPLAVLIIGRDVLLISGALLHRASTLGWQAFDFAEFFRLKTQSKADAAAGITKLIQQ